MNAICRPDAGQLTPGQDTSTLRGTKLKMFGGTFGGPIKKNKLFSFTSYEQWDDNRPLTIVRTVPTALERTGDFSQSVLSGRVRTIYNPFTSVLDPATGRVVRTPFAGNVIPSSMFDPVAAEDAAGDAAAEPAGQHRQPAVQRLREDRLLELLRSAWTGTSRDNWKIFVRYGQFKANLYQQNPTDAGFFPLVGQQPLRHEHRRPTRSGSCRTRRR